jgi:predicted RNA-binding protein YlqC (UPF0109 family)
VLGFQTAFSEATHIFSLPSRLKPESIAFVADHGEVEAYRILLLIVQHLVDDPSSVEIEIVIGVDGTTFHVRADRRNTSLLMGRAGRTAHSIRTLMVGMGMKRNWHDYLEIEGDPSDPNDPED